jgi:hypothetical protein
MQIDACIGSGISYLTLKNLTMKGCFILTVLIIMVFGCKKNSQINSLSGIYVETSPTTNENQLNFISGNQVIITGGQMANQANLTSGTFKYQVTGGIITLISSTSKPDTSSFLLQSLGNDSLRLDYNCGCYCLCPLSLYLIFVKK